MSSPPPPVIAPVLLGTSRPLWSVMIPTYNCADYLRETLTSVLRQAPEPDAMQIEVIDDCSTKDDPAAVVREIGQGRASFFRQPGNVGATANFNTCIARARGHLVHILHGDDFVLPGFYATVGHTFESEPTVSLVAVRSFIVDTKSEINALSARYPGLETPTRSAGALFKHNEIFTPGVAVRRLAYERHGGFRGELVHTADWEMWLRILAFEGGLMINRPLAGYRVHASNDTSRLTQTGENLRLGAIVAARSPEFSLADWRRSVGRMARNQGVHFRWLSPPNLHAARENFQLWTELTPLHLRLLQCIAAMATDRVQRWS
jgi:GT2 family glycosyltransferase